MKLIAVAAPLVLFAAACSPPASNQGETPVVQMADSTRAEMDRVNTSRFTTPMSPTLAPEPTERPGSGGQGETAPLQAAPPPAGETPTEATPAQNVRFDAGLVRIQVLLDRAHFSPGVIDGYDGENVRKAVSAYQSANDIPVNGLADEALLTRLEQTDAAPALVAYVLTEQDVSGPFVDVPNGLEAMSRLERVGYESAAEAIAEKFHMDEDLLRTLNPNVDFNTAGTEIVVANGGGELSTQVASIVVDIDEGAVRAFDASHQLLAYYPATIGSSDAPAPVGDHTVRGVAFDPTYRYDPERLPTFGQRDHGAVDIAAGPNNPVGVVWIALSAETYGIHGAPNPSLISKTQSHGCIRLTNWDATELGHAVQPGVSVRIQQTGSLAERGARRG